MSYYPCKQGGHKYLRLILWCRAHAEEFTNVPDWTLALSFESVLTELTYVLVSSLNHVSHMQAIIVPGTI